MTRPQICQVGICSVKISDSPARGRHELIDTSLASRLKCILLKLSYMISIFALLEPQ